jgi:predicted Zn-dependent protease
MRLLKDKQVAPGAPNTNNIAQPTPPPSTPQIPDALKKATVHCRMGQFSQALQVTTTFLKKHPDNPHAFLLMATAKMGLGQKDDAMKLLKRALDLDSSLADAHYNMAQLLLRNLEPDFDAARQHYQKSVKLGGAKDPDMEIVLAP